MRLTAQEKRRLDRICKELECSQSTFFREHIRRTFKKMAADRSEAGP
jgi:hypothetical protein